jgi:hypothetical protein
LVYLIGNEGAGAPRRSSDAREALMQKPSLPSIGLKSAGLLIGALILFAFMWSVSA